MRWMGGRESGNVEYSRGIGGKGIVGGGLGALIIGVIVYFLGGDPAQVSQLTQQGGQDQKYEKVEGEKDRTDRFVSVVLAETEDVWGEIFKQRGSTYREPKLNQFENTVSSACGQAGAATGPFYCPADEKIYLDKSFFDELSQRFGAPGDFANAYVIAHEVGHHVQYLLGITDKVDAMRGRLSQKEANRMSVKLELQADFLAGVWAHYAQKHLDVIEPGDIEAALKAANAIGDDRLQQQSQGRVVPDAFTHGTSQQRMYWFKKGYQTGDLDQGDTFTQDN